MTLLHSAEPQGSGNALRSTSILPVDASKIGRIVTKSNGASALEDWDMEWATDSPDLQKLQQAAVQLRSSNIPVAFPTETVYGLGADATRSAAVRGIYEAKQRPSDNPLIVHIYSLRQLRRLLEPSSAILQTSATLPTSAASPTASLSSLDLIPPIYHPLIQRFWPGPLTIILRTPNPSPLAPEVTAGLHTFGARMPRNLLALALLKLADVPVAAPSANASTRPSPTTAEHVLDDLAGRIDTIVDGGPCAVGVESTVVDGLADPPLILRPGGVTLEQLRACPGWERVAVGYKDAAEDAKSRPKAPGMKYRHYSPKAPVVLYEAGQPQPALGDLAKLASGEGRVGVIRTRGWTSLARAGAEGGDGRNGHSNEGEDSDNSDPQPNGYVKGDHKQEEQHQRDEHDRQQHDEDTPNNALANLLRAAPSTFTTSTRHFAAPLPFTLYEVHIGTSAPSIARGIFSALRLLDSYHVDRIVIEGIDDSGAGSELAAAIMNRVRKAADVKIGSQ
jgi:L-threonylcarbamoyladenylate synthase